MIAAIVAAILSVSPASAQGTDEALPPPGTRSLFDHFVKEIKSLPFPFEKLIQAIAEFSEGQSPPVSLLVPDGRSLVRSHADFQSPRVLVAAGAHPPKSFENDLGLPLRNRLFIGYVEKAAQLEIISYNEGAGRFEFQIVEDYTAGGVPRIGYARRSLCLTCHHGGTPIFPVSPWEETNVRSEVAKAIRIAQGAGRGAIYNGVAVEKPLAAAEIFDALTDNAGQMLTAQRIWREGCGKPVPSNRDCRRFLLMEALRFAWQPGLYRLGSETKRRLIAAQKIAWPKGGIPVPDTDLPNRRPDASPKGKWRSFLQSIGLGDDDGTAGLPPIANPATFRPPRRMLSATSTDGIYGLAQFFTPEDLLRLKEAGKHRFERVVQVIMKQDFAPVAVSGPMRRSLVMQALLRALGAEPVPGSCCDDDRGMSPPRVTGVQPIELADGSDLKVFRKYCFACHRGNPVEKLDFMAGDNEAAIWRRLKAVDDMAESLDWKKNTEMGRQNKSMPPRHSAQRKALEAVIAKGQDDLAAMQAAIRGAVR